MGLVELQVLWPSPLLLLGKELSLLGEVCQNMTLG